MPWWVWIGGLVLFAVAAAGLFFAVQRPTFVAGLVKSFAESMFKALLPIILRRMTPEQEDEWHKTIREGGEWDYARKQPKSWGH